MQRRFSICVYCGSRPGRNAAYGQAAKTLGEAIAARDWRLIYGAGDRGIMGAVAEAAAKDWADMLGVIPTHLIDVEAPDGKYGQRIVTETMHERKKVMLMNADAIVMLPGGAGSLDEFFEALTWAQLGLHRKPIWLCDVGGFWQPLLTLLDHVIEEGFAEDSLRGHVRVTPDADALVDALSRFAASKE